MPYIGKTPTAVPLTSSDITNDIITEAKIVDDAIENEHLNDNIISGQTALTSEPADTDEFLVSDAGTIKRIDYSLIKGGGKVLQVVTNTHATSTSTTSTSYVTTNLDASITPSSTSNKVLVLVSQNGVYKDGTGNGCDIELRRGSTSLGKLAENAGGENSGSYSIGTGATACYLDSPSTTSATTYETFFKRTGSDGAAYVQVYGCTSMITLLEIEA